MKLSHLALPAALTAMLLISVAPASAAGPSSASVFNHDVSAAAVGQSWASKTPVTDRYWSSVTYGNDLFVAVGELGGIMTSPDGTAWTARKSAQNSWNSVAYGDGLFVTVSGRESGQSKIMTSPDGVTWTLRNSADNYQWWTSVTYGNGLFVAVSDKNERDQSQIMTSPDGITWTSRTTPTDLSRWSSVTYGNGLFVAVARSGDIDEAGVMTSPDGITWTSRVTPIVYNSWYSVTYGSGLFVAVGQSDGSGVMTSPDGITWTSRTQTTALTAIRWRSVTYGNGLFVATANYNNNNKNFNQVMTSPDGITWAVRKSAKNNWSSATYGNGRFVAVAGYGSGEAGEYFVSNLAFDKIMTSPDGIKWTTVNPADALKPRNAFIIGATSAPFARLDEPITLTTYVKVLAAGRIAQTATIKHGKKRKTLCKAATAASHAAPYALTCKIGKAGSAALIKAKMNLTLRTSFKPVGGTLASKTQALQCGNGDWCFLKEH